MGAIEIAGHRIHDHKPFGELTVAQILANSSDVGAIKIALRLGEERFDHYIRAVGPFLGRARRAVCHGQQQRAHAVRHLRGSQAIARVIAT